MRALTVLSALVLAACGPNTAGIGHHSGGGSGTGGSGGAGGSSGTGGGSSATGGGDASCPDDAKVVYVVDTNNTFSSFDPMTTTVSRSSRR